MFPHSTLALWALITALKIVLLAAARRSNYPWFGVYMYISIVKTLCLWVMAFGGFERGYLVAYYAGGFIENVLILALIVHLGSLLFRPLEALPQPIYRAAKISGAILLAGIPALVLTFRSRHFTPLSIGERVGFALALAAIMITFVLARVSKIPWRNRAVWIGLGLTVSVLYPSQMLYLLAELTWLFGFIVPENLEIPTAEQMQELLPALRRIA